MPLLLATAPAWMIVLAYKVSMLIKFVFFPKQLLGADEAFRFSDLFWLEAKCSPAEAEKQTGAAIKMSAAMTRDNMWLIFRGLIDVSENIAMKLHHINSITAGMKFLKVL